MPSYLFPSLGAYLLCLPPFAFRTTLTGFPALQSLASEPSLSLIGALQFSANALQNNFEKEKVFVGTQPLVLKEIREEEPVTLLLSPISTSQSGQLPGVMQTGIRQHLEDHRFPKPVVDLWYGDEGRRSK